MMIQLVYVFIILLICFRAGAYDSDANDNAAASSHQRKLQAFGKVDNFWLINTDTNLPIVTLKDGMIIERATLGTINFNIQATTTNEAVVAVRFGYNGNSNFRNESLRPFALCGDNLPSGNFYVCKELVAGKHTIAATPYSASGEAGASTTISFTISDATVRPSSGSCNIEKFKESEWQQFSPNYPLSVAEPQGVIIGDDIVIFAGFINKFSDVINQTYARDITIDDSPWRRMDDMPLPVGVTHAATTVVEMKVYLCGGYHGSHPGPHVPYCFVYDHSRPPGNMQWSKIADLPNNGTAGAGMIYDTAQNALYYAGGGQRLVSGSPHPVDLNNTWKYSFDNPHSGWVASTPVPYKANHLSAVTHRNDSGQERHFFVGGQKGEFEIRGNLADTFEFVASEEEWIRRASMPLARSHTTASTRSVRCGFIMAGGSFNSMTSKKNRTTDISYYDIRTNSWASIGNAPVAMATPVVVIHPSGYIYFIDNAQQSFRRSFMG